MGCRAAFAVGTERGRARPWAGFGRADPADHGGDRPLADKVTSYFCALLFVRHPERSASPVCRTSAAATASTASGPSTIRWSASASSACRARTPPPTGASGPRLPIAPIKALVEDVASHGSRRPVEVFYGARTDHDLYDIDTLLQLRRSHSWLSVRPVVDAHAHLQLPDAL